MATATTSLTLLMNGLFFATAVFAVGIGFSFVFKVLDFFNFSHTVYLAFGAYLTAAIANSVFDSFTMLGYLGVVVLVTAVAMVGTVALDRTVFKPLYDLKLEFQILTTFALVLIAETLLGNYWGYAGMEIDSQLSPLRNLGDFQIAGFNYPMYYLLLGMTFFVIAFALMLVLERTKVGKLFQAMAEHPSMVSSLGFNTHRLKLLLLCSAGGLAALGGALLVPINAASTSMIISYIIFALAVVVIGGLGSLRGAIVASLIIGMTRSFGSFYVPQWQEAIVFLFMALVIVVKPEGLYGGRGSLR